MKYPNKDYIEHLRRKYPPGTRLQLSCMEDDFPVPPGSMGTVECIDDAGQIHMNWDCGRSLALIPGVDSFSRLPSPKEKAGDGCIQPDFGKIQRVAVLHLGQRAQD